MARAESKSEHTLRSAEQTSPSRNTSEKFSSLLKNRIFRDIIHLLDLLAPVIRK